MTPSKPDLLDVRLADIVVRRVRRGRGGLQQQGERDRHAAGLGGPPGPLKKGSGELLLLGAPRTAGVRFCCPVRPEPRFCQSNLDREVLG